MKRFKVVFAIWMILFLIMKDSLQVYGKEFPILYAKYAAVIDGRTGRLLYGKGWDKQVPMASTTKILTCILALENAKLTDQVKISEYASKMPQVRMGVKPGEVYELEDLLLALMLESYNDVAVAIAEHVSGTVEKFASLMNEKAEKICRKHFYFITPNGLDAQNEEGRQHSITPYNLARIMRYCTLESPCRKEFLEITRMKSHSFSNGNRSFFISNHNQLLSNPSVCSGKTGFTAKAGYCYVCEAKINGYPVCISLLACGWPNNKTYKWKDTMKILEYLKENSKEVKIDRSDVIIPKVEILDLNHEIGKKYKGKDIVELGIIDSKEKEEKYLVLCEDAPHYCIYMQKKLKAPIRKNQQIGKIKWYIGESFICEEPIVARNSIKRRNVLKEVNQCFNKFLTICIKSRVYLLKSCT